MVEYYDWGLGSGANDPYWGNLGDPTVQSKISTLSTAQNEAIAAGNKQWQTILNFVLGYGAKALSILTTTGVIKNQNLSNLTSANGFDATKFAALLGDNKVLTPENANIDDAKNPTDPNRSTNEILGIPVSYLLVALALFIGYMIYRDKDEPKKSKS